MHNNCSFGRAGEDLAAAHFIDLGWSIITRNYRCKIGEIDIIGFDSGAVVFCEVKTRSCNSFGGAVLAVNQAKFRRLQRVASYFCAVSLPDVLPEGTSIRGISYRFDLVAIDFNRSGIPTIQHIRAI